MAASSPKYASTLENFVRTFSIFESNSSKLFLALTKKNDIAVEEETTFLAVSSVLISVITRKEASNLVSEPLSLVQQSPGLI